MLRIIDLDNPETTIDRIKIIENKPFLKKLYTGFYKIFRKESQELPIGKKIEIGSGAGFLKGFIPDVITSDIMKLPNCDLVVSAEKMPFMGRSLSVIYMLNTFHHIKNPKRALSEFSRCLKSKGKVIMIEPYNSLWGRFIYKNFSHENFDPNSGWGVKNKGPVSGANGALPWIIFLRDKKKFGKIFPELKIIKVNPHTPIAYNISGGFKWPSLLPHQLYALIKIIEKLLSPLNKQLGMFVTIVLEKS